MIIYKQDCTYQYGFDYNNNYNIFNVTTDTITIHKYMKLAAHEVI